MILPSAGMWVSLVKETELLQNQVSQIHMDDVLHSKLYRTLYISGDEEVLQMSNLASLV